MPLHPSDVEHLRTICSNVFFPGTNEYVHKAAPWSIWADKNPQLVVEPQDLGTLASLVEYLYDSDLDFCTRNTGTGGSSASDVCLSMHGFKSFTFDRQEETVIAGAGLSWGELDMLMQKETDATFACVGARCTWVGITGGTIVGGLSWLSHEYGMSSDPQNLLDAQVILKDGRVIWAGQEEPDLMWALRGGGGNFGVTALKFRARPTPPKIFAAIIVVPYTSLAATSSALAKFHLQPTDPAVALHIMNTGPGLGLPDSGPRPSIALMPISFHGSTHAQRETFSWIYSLPGATELTSGEFTYAEINALSDSFKNYQGKNLFFLSAPLIDNIDEKTLVRMWKWYEESYNAHPGFGVGSTVLLEFMQKGAFNSSEGKGKTAWPHEGRRHVVQLVLGCEPDSLAPDSEHATSQGRIRGLIMKRFKIAGEEIGRESFTKEYHAGFLHEWNDLAEVYKENYPRLKDLKKRYDPDNRFNKGVDLTEGRVTKGMTV